MSMEFLGEVEGCRAHWTDVGAWFRLGAGTTVPVRVWAFSAAVAVASTGAVPWGRAEVGRPGKTITPEDIETVSRKLVWLEREGVVRIDVGKARFRRNRSVLGVEHVNFEYVDGRTFDLMVVSKRRADEFLPMLRKIYPAKVWDSRGF